ncbi:MAG: AbiV family abortive infection protein [Mucilaginibacter sp.]
MIDENELKNGVNVCLSNAESLINDAELLKANGRNERAYTLFQLASEEIGKASQVLNFLLLEDINNPNSYKLFLKEFHSHKSKTTSFINYDYFVLKALKEIVKDKRKFLDATVYEYNNLNLINDRKNHSLYTSIINNKFASPRQLISIDHLNHIEFRIITRFKIAKAMIEAALSVSFEIREYLRVNPLNKKPLEIKAIKEFNELLKS